MRRMSALVRTLAGAAARSMGRAPGLRPLLVGAYYGVARAGARWLAAVPHARGVYLAGSLLRPATVAPGVSDIDLVLTAELPSLEAELAFRAGLRNRLRQLNGVVPAFYNLDYFDA